MSTITSQSAPSQAQVQGTRAARLRAPFGVGRLRRTLAAIVTTVALALVPLAVGTPAQAIDAVRVPAGLGCSSNSVSFRPPRVWASENHPETVRMIVVINRWNGKKFVRVAVKTLWNSVNNQGYAVTYWPYQVNNFLTFRVARKGYYAVQYHISGNQNNLYWTGIIDGRYCYVG